MRRYRNHINGELPPQGVDWDYVKRVEDVNDFLLRCRSQALAVIREIEPTAEITDRGLKIDNETWPLPGLGGGYDKAMRLAAEAIAIAEGEVDGWYWHSSYDWASKNDEKSGLGYDFSKLSMEEKKKRFLKLAAS